MNEFLLHHQSLLQALGLAMLHSLGQGFILFLLLKIILPLVPGKKANARYLISYTALLALFGGFLYTFFAEWQAAKLAAGFSIQQQVPVALAATGGGNDAVSAGGAWHLSLDRYLDTFRRYLPLMALGYAFGICILCCRMIWQIFKVQALRREVIDPGAELDQVFTALRERIGWSRKVMVKLSRKVNVPVVFGHLKPLVLLPVALVSKLDVQQLEAILLHEIGHVRRHDYLFNMLQSVIETLLFFNPFTRWIATNIRIEREHCCDDFVLKHTRQSLPYAYVLLALEEYRSASLAPAMAADGNSKSPLFNRIKRITTMTSSKQKKQRNLGAVTVLVLVAAMICFATAFSQDKKETPAIVAADEPAEPAQTQAPQETADSYPQDPQNKNKQQPAESSDEDRSAEAMTADDAMKIAREAMSVASKSMKEIDWNKVADDAQKASKEIDWNEIRQSLEEAKVSIDAVDWEEMRKSVKEAQSSIDWSEVRKAMKDASKEVDKAMKELDQELKKDGGKHSLNLQDRKRSDAQLAAASAKADAAMQRHNDALARQEDAIARQEEAIRRQQVAIDRARSIARVKQEEAMRKQQTAMEYAQRTARIKQEEAMRKHDEAMRKHNDAVRQAQERIREAEVHVQQSRVAEAKSRSETDELVDRLARMGLVDKKGNFKVRIAKNKLEIDGKEQPEAIASQFRSYMADGKTMTITVNNN